VTFKLVICPLPIKSYRHTSLQAAKILRFEGLFVACLVIRSLEYRRYKVEIVTVSDQQPVASLWQRWLD
jgi:hypothetical protein